MATEKRDMAAESRAGVHGWREARRTRMLLSGIAAALFLLLLIEEAIWGTRALDARITSVLEHPDTRLLDRISNVFTTLAGIPVSGALAALATALLWQRYGRRTALAFMTAFVCGLAIEALLKALLHHPDVPGPFQPPGTLPPNSFPSGHVLRAALLALAAGLLWPRRIVYIVAIGIVAAVGYTRIYAGAHWTSDVVGALLLAVALSAAVANVARTDRARART